MNFKRLAVLALSAVIAFGVSVQASGFYDIKGHWAEDTINNLADKGVVNGVSADRFNPEGTVTRAEFLKMAMEVMGISTADYRYGECLEASKSDWFAPYLQSALDRGLIPEDMVAGYDVKIVTNSDGTTKAVYSGAFNGYIPITREEMAVIAQYTYQYTRNANTMKQMANSGELKFKGSDSISGWAYESVKLAYAQGFIDGMDNGKFEPASTATRAQAATIAERMMNVNEGN